MSVAQKEVNVSCYNLQEIVKSLDKESVIGRNFDGAVSSLRKSKDWSEVTSDPRNGKVLPSAYFFWNVDKNYSLVVPPNFNKPAHLEVRVEHRYLLDKESKGLPSVQILSSSRIVERVYAGMGMTSQEINNPRRCIFDRLVNLDILFNVMKESGANIDQVVERFSDQKIGFKSSRRSIDFAELESPVYFSLHRKIQGYLILSLKEGREIKVNVVYRPQV